MLFPGLFLTQDGFVHFGESYWVKTHVPSLCSVAESSASREGLLDDHNQGCSFCKPDGQVIFQ